MTDRTREPCRRPALPAVLFALTATLVACGGSDDGERGVAGGRAGDEASPPGDDAGREGAGAESEDDAGEERPIAGDIALYGVIAVGDEAGLASDALASFSRLSTSVAPAAFGSALATGDGESVPCRVTPSGPPELMDLGVVFLPTPAAVSLLPVGAGETVTLDSPSGSYVELIAGPSERFYEPFPGTLPTGAVPRTLSAAVSAGEFPAFERVSVPDVDVLVDVALDGVAFEKADTFTADTRISWRAGSGDEARIRVTTSTAGGFFREDGIDIACLVPDTGSFVIPAEQRAALGDGFSGEIPTISRVSLRSERRGEALLVVVRESFAR